VGRSAAISIARSAISKSCERWLQKACSLSWWCANFSSTVIRDRASASSVSFGPIKRKNFESLKTELVAHLQKPRETHSHDKVNDR
jgi:hypothetical protein